MYDKVVGLILRGCAWAALLAGIVFAGYLFWTAGVTAGNPLYRPASELGHRLTLVLFGGIVGALLLSVIVWAMILALAATLEQMRRARGGLPGAEHDETR